MHALLIIAACLIAQAPSAQDTLAEDIDKAIVSLSSDRHTESDLARQELTDIGRKAVPKLLAELDKPRETDKTKQIRVRRLICEILGDIRDNSQPVLDALVGRLTDADEYGTSVAAAAAGALDKIADDKVAGALVTALTTSKQAETDAWFRYYCVHALGVMRAASGAEAIRKALDQGGAAQIAGKDVYLMTAAAADALGRLRAKDSVEALGKLLSNSQQDPSTNQTVAVHAARALERITGVPRGALDGEQAVVTASVEAWKKWWDVEQTKKNIATTTKRIEEISAALEAYKRDHNNYPSILAYLKEKQDNLQGPWPEGGYYKGEGLDKKVMKDAWGNEIRYVVPGKYGAPFDLFSYGKDGRAWGKGDNADIWNHPLWKSVKIEQTRKAIDDTAAAVKKFNDEQKRYPTSLSDLVTKPSYQLTDWKQYLPALLKDGFDNDLIYKQPGTGGEPFDLYSLGADRAIGGTDENADIWNHDKWKTPRTEVNKTKIEEVGKAIEQFRKDYGRYPEQLADLKEKPAWANAKWKATGPADSADDAFGNPFVYRAPGKDNAPFDLGSLGADGKEGGAGVDEDVWYKHGK